jgi:hypothetical protein
MLERYANYLTDLMERQIGLPGLLPRYQPRRPGPVVQQTGPVNFQNMRVEKSTIGSIATVVLPPPTTILPSMPAWR